MPADNRNDVLVIGDVALDVTEFKHRYLHIKPVKPEDAPMHFDTAKAIVVVDVPRKFLLIKECYTSVFLKAADHGLAQIVMVHSSEDLRQVDALRKIEYPNSTSRIFLVGETWKAAEFIARHSIGPPARNVAIDAPGISLPDEIDLLLRRAFYDCDQIFLKCFPGGKASIGVYRVHARMLQSDAGPHPFPFFFKVAELKSIEEEKEKYRKYAEHYIPFHLRPNLSYDRCVRTSNRAALVGNFVDDAIPLREALRSGQGIGALFSLFETSLKGFRLQPFGPLQKPRDDVLPGIIQERVKVEKIPADVVECARIRGLNSSPVELEAKLRQLADGLPCRIGPCHGDLHSGNIMVRGGDAILFDFSSASDGPLTADPAALEVSLMFGTDGDDEGNSFDTWQSFTDKIYHPTNLTLRPPALHEGRPGPYSWLRRSIRELRHILLGCEAGELEAKLVLAAYLMRYARLGLETLENPKLKPLAFDRHAYALVVAERIVTNLGGGNAPKGNS